MGSYPGWGFQIQILIYIVVVVEYHGSHPGWGLIQGGASRFLILIYIVVVVDEQLGEREREREREWV